ncbi:hypothetical protein I6M34_12245 [Shewanella algae]|uniref:hypothetical protein n=1 Tax=Shewanella algae TaxID=38313 RepID=UPI001AAD1188|nr:hypothetical protein [Shewanella algae]MBO2603865.1 hypothetical protein [Shewanella algae]
MTGFNNQAYSALVEDLLNDAFYIGERSPRGTIATIRQYAEVIVRKILNFSNEEYVTLGNKKIIEALNRASNNNSLLLDALKKITDIGNKCTHTQRIEQVTDQEVESTLESLFDLYAYLYVNYFGKYRFGENEEIQSSFSILPPIIRYIALSSLYDLDTENVAIIDKLSLAILKAFDEQTAIDWLNERKDELKSMSSVTPEAESDLKEKFGAATASIIVNQAPNMYDLCFDRVKTVNVKIQEKGRLYYDFESAIELYKKEGVVSGESDAVSEFNDLMDFVYLGRKARENEKLKDKDAYLIMDNLYFE